jgi:hypothetical protein
MANPEHLKVLNQGREAWTEFNSREEFNLGNFLDLSELDFSNRIFENTNLIPSISTGAILAARI